MSQQPCEKLSSVFWAGFTSALLKRLRRWQIGQDLILFDKMKQGVALRCQAASFEKCINARHAPTKRQIKRARVL